MKRGAWLLGLLVLVLTACPNPGPPDFELRVDPNGLTLHQGESKTISLIVVPVRGFKGTLRLGLEGAPTGVSLSPESVEVTGSGENRFDLTLEADSSATLGNYSLTLRATQGKVSHQVGLTLTLLPPAGTLDASFGEGGVVVLNTGNDDIGYSLAFGDGGTIYVLGRDAKYPWVRKFDDAGNPVSGFGNSGTLSLGTALRTLDTTERDKDLDHALLRLPSGDFLAAGYAYDAVNDQDDLLLAKFDASGALDTGFGSGGSKTYDNLLYSGSGHANERAYSLALAPDGVWVAGFAYKDTTDKEQALIMKVNLADLDNPGRSDFGGTGSEYAYTVTPLSDGAFFAGTTNEGGLQGGWARVDQDLNEVGHGLLSVFEGGRITASALDAEGRVLLAGYAYNGSDYDVVVVRMNIDGSLDSSFGSDGVVQLDRLGGSPGSDRVFSLTVDGEGHILLAGRTFVSGRGDDLMVLRLLPDGALDPSFGNQGIFLWDGGHGQIDSAFEVAIDDHGRIVVTGFSYNGTDNDLVLLRLVP